jgi:transposase InsO family protein
VGPTRRTGYLVRDRDGIYGEAFHRQARALGIEEVPTAPQSPWQNPYAERVIGSIRRECLDHVIVVGAGHLRRILSGYADHYNGIRTHLSLSKDAPESRIVQPPAQGIVRDLEHVGGLHHEYVRMAA